MAREKATFIPPMKALGVAAVPQGTAARWHCEIKFDGYRAIALLNGRKAGLWSRNRKPLDYPELLPALAGLKCRSAVLDGEIVALDDKGHTHFQTLQGRDLGERPPIVFYVFDLLQLNGRSLLAEPIETRQERLRKLVGRDRATLKLSPSFAVEPAVFFETVKRQGLEGMVLKQHGSRYEPGRRSGAWLKVKRVNEQEFVIGGFTPPQHSREHFGAILVGYYEGKTLRYDGKVGSGFDRELLATLHARFQRLKRAQCPFANLPLPRHARFGTGMTPAVMRTVTWLRPQLVAQIKFAEWTAERLLRQPVFLGLRKDKPASAVTREAGAALT